MNTWDRFQNAIARKKVDHVPIALIGTNRFFASTAGYSLRDVLYNPDMMIEAQRITFELFPEITFIPGVWPDYGVAILSAYGCNVFWTENGMPQIKGEIIKDQADLNSLRIPNPRTDGLMPLYLYTLQKFLKKEEIFRNNLRFAWSFGPGELASYLYGTTQFLMSLISSREFTLDLLEKVTEGIIVWINAQLEVNPFVEGFLLTDDIAGMVSREHYEEIIFPYHRRIREAFPDHLIVFHNDSKSDHILESVAETGFDVFNFGKTTDINKCKEVISERICLMGNVDPLDLMINGSKEMVYEAAKDCLSTFSGASGYLLSVGGGMNQGIPVENIHALVDAARSSVNGT